MNNLCPVCGNKLKKKLSFRAKGKFPYNKGKRETLVCDCGYSTIVETERESNIAQGMFDNI